MKVYKNVIIDTVEVISKYNKLTEMTINEQLHCVHAHNTQ